MGILRKASLFLTATLFAGMLISSCQNYDDRELRDRIETLDSRITYIEFS